MERCIYCGYTIGSTKEHIVPKSLLTDLKLFIHRPIEPPEHNIAPCCPMCNNAKVHRFICPTPGFLTDAYINMPTVYVQDLAEWITFNKNELLSFFDIEKNRRLYNVELYEIETVITLYWKNYYEKLNDTSRNIPNNKFNRIDIELRH